MGIPRRLGERVRRTGAVAGRAALGAARRLVASTSVEADRALGEALFAELDQLKGMAMKVGQILSYLDVGLPPETQAVLARLQQGVSPLPLAEVAAVVEAALGQPLSALFDAFETVPVAAASIGQVHRAVLRGQPVAVKVQYPGVRETFQADTTQLRRLARLASLAASVDGLAIVEELQARLDEECDYRREAHWLSTFGAAFQHQPGMALPTVIADRSAETVLTTTWCAGERLDSLLSETPTDVGQERRDRVGQVLARFAWRSLWVHHTINADPHPGNQLFQADGGVVFLDFGCVRRFSAARVDAERAVLAAVLAGNRADFRAAVLAAGGVAQERGFDFDQHWSMARFLWEPYLTPRYRFARDWMLRGRAFSQPSNPNLRKMGIPPENIWLQRLHWGLHALLARLEAEGPFGDALREALETPPHPFPPLPG